MTAKKESDSIYNLGSRMSSMEVKVSNIDEKVDIVISKIDIFFESSINLKNLEKEFEKQCLRNDLQYQSFTENNKIEHKTITDENAIEHKNFISKVGFYTVSSILGIIIVGITIMQFVIGR